MIPDDYQGRRYYSFDAFLKRSFGEKVYKIALNGGMTCPNRDGTLDTRGCIFCSQGGSGEFAGSPSLSITQQIEQGKLLVQRKQSGQKYIAYFQAYTNTYAPIEHLKQIFTEAIDHPDICALSIGTRPDCLPLEVLDLLSELQKKKPVWIELGLQTIHEQSARFIRRGYPLSCFEDAVSKLQERKIDCIVHVILGLPHESAEDMLATIKYLSHLPVQGIKLQLLHILKQTDLASYYKTEPFSVFTFEEYCDIIVRCLELLPPSMVIHRMTGDGKRDLLIEPLWSLHKRKVLNQIQHLLKERNTWQGRCYSESFPVK